MKPKLTGSLINYYIHCKRQCWLSYNKINMEYNSEAVSIGKALHKKKYKDKKHSEVFINNIRLDKINDKYVIETKKSDYDIEAAKWQLIFYLKELKDLGIEREGKLEILEKNNPNSKKVYHIKLTTEVEMKLNRLIKEIYEFLETKQPPICQNCNQKLCSYYEYCSL